MKRHILSVLLSLAGLLGTAVAQTPIVQSGPVEILIAAGSSSGTYKQFLKEIVSVTGDTVSFKEVDSHGSVENLDLLINNRVMAAFMHSDVIYFRAQSTDLSRFKTLLALFKEDVHFLTLTTGKRTTGGTMGFNKTIITVNSVDDLGKPGMKVGAAGGGFITAQVIRLQAQIGYEVVQFPSGSAVLTALNAGEIDAAVFVGAAPLPNLSNLGPEYKLLSMGDTTASRLKAVYSPTSYTYIKMRPEPITSIAADALLVAREYKTPRFVLALKQFRATFNQRLDEIRETPGTSPAWSQVQQWGASKWPMLDLGDPTTTTTVQLAR